MKHFLRSSGRGLIASKHIEDIEKGYKNHKLQNEISRRNLAGDFVWVLGAIKELLATTPANSSDVGIFSTLRGCSEEGEFTELHFLSNLYLFADVSQRALQATRDRRIGGSTHNPLNKKLWHSVKGAIQEMMYAWSKLKSDAHMHFGGPSGEENLEPTSHLFLPTEGSIDEICIALERLLPLLMQDIKMAVTRVPLQSNKVTSFGLSSVLSQLRVCLSCCLLYFFELDMVSSKSKEVVMDCVSLFFDCAMAGLPSFDSKTTACRTTHELLSYLSWCSHDKARQIFLNTVSQMFDGLMLVGLTTETKDSKQNGFLTPTSPPECLQQLDLVSPAINVVGHCFSCLYSMFEYTWRSHVVRWKFDFDALVHHDFKKDYNGKLLLGSRIYKFMKLLYGWKPRTEPEHQVQTNFSYIHEL